MGAVAKANQDVRQVVKDAGIYLWQIADKMGIYDTGLVKQMRKELSPAKKAEIFEIIEKLKREVI